MPLREFSFALIALASQFRAPARSGLTLFQPQQFAPKISCPSGCRFSNRLLPGCSDIPQQRSLTFRSPVLPASVCASQNFRAKWMPLQNCNLHFPMRCFGLLALPFRSSWSPLSAAICTFHLLSFAPSCRGRSPFQACPRLSSSQRACRSASGNQPLPWAQSPCLVRALSHMDLTFPWEAPAFAPIFAQRAIELQAVPSIQ